MSQYPTPPVLSLSLLKRCGPLKDLGICVFGRVAFAYHSIAQHVRGSSPLLPPGQTDSGPKECDKICAAERIVGLAGVTASDRVSHAHRSGALSVFDESGSRGLCKPGLFTIERGCKLMVNAQLQSFSMSFQLFVAASPAIVSLPL